MEGGFNSEPISSEIVSNSEVSSETSTEETNSELMNMLVSVTDGVSELMTENAYLTKENTEFDVRVPFDSFEEGVIQYALIGAQAHQVALFKLAEDTDVESFKNTLLKKNSELPSKWVCVEADKILVENKGNIVLLVMSMNDIADKYVENFKNIK